MYEMVMCLLTTGFGGAVGACGLQSGVVVATYLGSVGLEQALTSWSNLPPEVSPSGLMRF